MTKPPLTLFLAAPRGFCAGVDRAIKIVELALEKWGAPVYVRHEIVHNKFVVDDLKSTMGTNITHTANFTLFVTHQNHRFVQVIFHIRKRMRKTIKRN